MQRFRGLFLIFAAFCGLSYAAPYTSIVAYGDSLSDNGNLYALTNYPPPPYYAGRFSNGPVAVEVLASLWDLPLRSYAVAGATTGLGNFADGGTPTVNNGLPGMTTMFASTFSMLDFTPGQLFVIWGGPNDFQSPAAGDSIPGGVIGRAVGNLATMASGLQSAGAQNILMLGMPDMGLTPYYRLQGIPAASQATAVTDAFNNALRAALPHGVMYLDTAELLRSIVSNPAAYGYTNVTDPCFSGAAVCSSPDSYLFWDEMHPTAVTHSLVAGAIAAQAVPEPSVLTLTAAGLCLLGSTRKFRRRRASSLD